MEYMPELGQSLFGQPHKQFAVNSHVEAALAMIREELDRVMWNRDQREYASPFGNTGNTFDCSAFSAHAYSWSDEEQPWNFKCGPIEISWYKYLGRGMSANMEITPDMSSDMLDKCLKELRNMDDEKK